MLNEHKDYNHLNSIPIHYEKLFSVIYNFLHIDYSTPGIFSSISSCIVPSSASI